MSRFEKIVGLYLEHDYFEEGITYPVQFSLEKKSKEICRKYGIQIRFIQNGAELYADPKGTLSELLQYIGSITSEQSFRFELHSSDDRFRMYTDFPLVTLGRMEFSSHQVSETAPDCYDLLKMDLKEGEFNEFAGVELFFDDLLNSAQPVNYQIRLQARETQWKYFIINKSQLDLDQPAVVGKSDVEFDGPSSVRLENGQEAMLFSSGSRYLKLSQRPKYQFSLVNNLKGNGRMANSRPTQKRLFKSLPSPNPERIEINHENGTQLVSSLMYVYV